MFDYIKGQFISSSINSMVIEVGGIGYLLNASNQTIINCENKDSVKVFTYMYVREDEMSLYGFYSINEREMFLDLISVGGIGPKLAIQILSSIRLEDLALSIATGDASYFIKIKGVGKKTAERIILELKGKVNTIDFAGGSTVSGSSQSNGDAIEALMTLGFSKADAVRAISKTDADLTLEEKITAALRMLGR